MFELVAFQKFLYRTSPYCAPAMSPQFVEFATNEMPAALFAAKLTSFAKRAELSSRAVKSELSAPAPRGTGATEMSTPAQTAPLKGYCVVKVRGVDGARATQ